MDPVEVVTLGGTALRVTRLGLGTVPLGGFPASMTDADAERLVSRACAAGIRLFDTAPLYGHGAAERRLGTALRSGARESFVLGTKVGRVLCAHAPSDSSRHAAGRAIFADATPLVPVFDFSYDAARRSLDESLTRLGLDRVDIVHIHDPDDFIDEALGGAYRALAGLRRDGVITAVSVGVTSAEVALRFVRDADLDCILLARRYTLLDQSALGALLPLCAARGIGVIVGGVYHSGLLAAPAHGTMFDYAPAEPDAVARVQRLDAVCREYDVPLNAAAIQFPFGHPAVTSVVVGCHSTPELDDNLAALRHRIPGELWTRLKREGVIVPNAPVPA